MLQKLIIITLFISATSSINCMQGLMSRMRCTRLSAPRLTFASPLFNLQKRFVTSHLHGDKAALEQLEKKAQWLRFLWLMKTINSRKPYDRYFAKIESNQSYAHFCEVETREDALNVMKATKQGSFPCGYHSLVTYNNNNGIDNLDFGGYSKRRCPSAPPQDAVPQTITWYRSANSIDLSKVKWAPYEKNGNDTLESTR